jgi:hypothetical protein
LQIFKLINYISNCNVVAFSYFPYVPFTNHTTVYCPVITLDCILMNDQSLPFVPLQVPTLIHQPAVSCCQHSASLSNVVPQPPTNLIPTILLTDPKAPLPTTKTERQDPSPGNQQFHSLSTLHPPDPIQPRSMSVQTPIEGGSLHYILSYDSFNDFN